METAICYEWLKINFKNFVGNGVDIARSRLREVKEKIEELYPSEILKFKFIEGNVDKPLLSQITILIPLFV